MNSTLVVLAAGIGSRYGGLKQLDEISPFGETIIDFSLYDAVKTGFTKVIFVVRDEILEDFKSVFNKKLSGKIQARYVIQNTADIPEKFLPTKRQKPWGTAHALFSAREEVEENFCVINADDFYGREAFEIILRQIQKTDPNSADFSMVGYPLKNTLSENGSVSRGQCFVSEEGFLRNITERLHITKKNGGIFYREEKMNEIALDPETIVSMNFWGFTPKIFKYLDEEFKNFLEENSNNRKAEFYIPAVIDKLIGRSDASVRVLRSNAKWMGITYKEDKASVISKIKELREKGIYPHKLW